MHERWILWMSVVLALVFTGGTLAQASAPARSYAEGTGRSYSADDTEMQTAALASQYPALRQRQFDIGGEVYQYEYEEPGVMEEKGVFFGVRLGYTGRDWVGTSEGGSKATGGGMFRVEGRFAGGQVDYDGGIIDFTTFAVTPYTMDDIDDWVFEGRLLLGGDWLHENALNTLYAGIGYRYLNDDASSDPVGYERESNYLYIPVGYQFGGRQEVGWSFGFGAEFDIFVLGNQTSHLSDADPTYPDIDNRQDSGYGCRGSVKIQYKGEKSVFVLEPFVRYWDIDESEPEYVSFGPLWEPANKTTEYGLSIIWMF
jgi:hypothetical protein